MATEQKSGMAVFCGFRSIRMMLRISPFARACTAITGQSSGSSGTGGLAMTYGPFTAGIDHAERRARCRALRALGVVLLGSAHPLLPILAAAETDDAALEVAQRTIDQLGALSRRRLLSCYVKVAR
jgi:hypothetical protein